MKLTWLKSERFPWFFLFIFLRRLTGFWTVGWVVIVHWVIALSTDVIQCAWALSSWTDSWATSQLYMLPSLADKCQVKEGLPESGSDLYTQQTQHTHTPSQDWLMRSPITFRFSQGPWLTSASGTGECLSTRCWRAVIKLGVQARLVEMEWWERRTVTHAKPQWKDEGGCAWGKIWRGWIIHLLTFSKQFTWWSQIRNDSKWLKCISR